MIRMKPDEVFRQGFLAGISETLFTGGKLKFKLPCDQVIRIASVLGILSKKYDLYNLLFEESAQLIDLLTFSVHTRDLTMFVLMDHAFTRGWWMKPSGSSFVVDTTMCQGVPIALEGKKRLFNISYMSWFKDIDLTSRKSTIRLDIFLPHELNSLEINVDTGDIQQANHLGLLSFYNSEVIWTSEDIRKLQIKVPDYLARHNPAMLSPNNEHDFMYNACAAKMRCLLLQGWCWAPNIRNSYMITDVKDWDNVLPSATHGFDGFTPSEIKLPPGLQKWIK